MALCDFDFEEREIDSRPTVLPAEDFDPETDAKVFYKAMKGFGTDEDKIMAIVANRSSGQLMAVEKKFLSMYGDYLKSWLKKELNGKFEEVVLARFRGPREYQAYLLRHAMAEMGTDDRALIDVICTKDKHEMEMVGKAYNALYHKDLIEDIASKTSGDFRRILVSLASAGRDTEPIDEDLAKSDVEALYDAGEGKWGTDEETFNRIFAGRSLPQLRATFRAYTRKTGQDMATVIENEMNGKLKDVFLTLVRYIQDPITYWTEVLYHSMKGMGSDDDTLIRTVLSRCEIDLGDIKKRFEKLHQETLDKAIKNETKGDYRKIMLMITMDSEEKSTNIDEKEPTPPEEEEPASPDEREPTPCAEKEPTPPDEKEPTPTLGDTPWFNKFLVMSNGDLMFIKNQSTTGTGLMEVHILTAVSNYQTFGLQAATPLELDNTKEWHFQLLSNNDLMCIYNKAPITEVQILGADSNYQTFGLNSKIELAVEDGDSWHFQLISGDDLMCIKDVRLDGEKIEVHILTANSNYAVFRLHTKSVLDSDLDDQYRFKATSDDDLICIKKSGTDSQKTEVHILSAEGDYQDFAMHSESGLDMDLANAWQFEAMSNGDLMCINYKAPTGSNMTEVHILTRESSYRNFALQTGTALHLE